MSPHSSSSCYLLLCWRQYLFTSSWPSLVTTRVRFWSLFHTTHLYNCSDVKTCNIQSCQLNFTLVLTIFGEGPPLVP